ncbi:MAG TPA: magnesium and cobalt transport protein CorA [Candidatus Nanopelagicales bacterium]|nr:magnesium and cobalt transport protein CorA [Candidatus Nanopelagicales bacterium]
MTFVIRAVGVYHPEGTVDGFDDSARQIPANHDLSGEQTYALLARMRDEARNLPGGFAWVGLLNPTKPELAMVAELFALEPLQVEDAANPHQRAKVDVSEEGELFTVIKTLGYNVSSNEVETGQVAIFTGPGFAITIRHGEHGDLTAVRSRIRASRVLRTHGPLSVLYAILDMTVDGYLAVIDEVNDDVGEVETSVFGMSPSPGITQMIYELKRENMVVRRAVHPLLRVAHSFADEVFDPIPEDLKPYFRDVGEHILRVNDTVESTDSLLMTMLMASTAMRDLQQNADARKISAWVAIAAVPTVAGGIYGMNFEYMPELAWQWSYPTVLAVILGICVLLYRGFKRNGWL